VLENFEQFPASVKSSASPVVASALLLRGRHRGIPPQTRKEPLVSRIHYGLGLRNFFPSMPFFVFAMLFKPSFNDLGSCFFKFLCSIS